MDKKELEIIENEIVRLKSQKLVSYKVCMIFLAAAFLFGLYLAIAYKILVLGIFSLCSWLVFSLFTIYLNRDFHNNNKKLIEKWEKLKLEGLWKK